MDLTEKFIRGEQVFAGKLLKVYRDVISMPDGHEEIREVLRHPGAAVIVPHLGENRYVLVRQYRYALQKETIEFPAGRLDPGEDPLSCAQRELVEETGYRAERFNYLFKIHPASGYTDELIHVYKAENLVEGVSNPDPDEVVLTVQKSFDELLEMVRNGEITDSKTANALLFLQCFPCD